MVWCFRVKVLEGRAEIADARHQLGSLEDQIADLTSSFNDMTGLPLQTNTELVEPVEQAEEAAAPESGATGAEILAVAHNPELLSARQELKKARAGLHAARAEYIPDVSFIVQHTYQNGAPLLPQNAYVLGFHSEWTISEFGKRIGLVRERKSQVSEAEQNLRATENRVRMDVDSEVRKIHRSETGLAAARENVSVRAELVRITNDQVVAKTVTESALKEAQAQLAEAKAALFDAQMQRVVAQAELLRTVGRQ